MEISNTTTVVINTVGTTTKRLDWVPPFKSVVNYTASQNLGQTYNGIPRYLSIDPNGNNAGVGYGFEDLTKLKWVEQGNEVESVSPVLNGADFILNGEPCQLKCGTDGCKSAQHLYEGHYGPCKYKGQTAVVPKGQGSMAEKTVRIRKQMNCGGPEKIIESPVSRTEAEAYTNRGWKSFCMDAKDRNIYGPSIGWGFGIAITGAAIDISIHRKEMTKKKAVIKGLKWFGIGTALTAINLVCACSYRQTLRP